MSNGSKQFQKIEIGSFSLCISVSALLAVAMSTVMADEVEYPAPDSAIHTKNADTLLLKEMAANAGISMTQASAEYMLDAHPELLDKAMAATQPTIKSAAAIYPARLQVDGQTIIYQDTLLNSKSAGGRFTSGGIDVLLNYSSVLSGISYENRGLSATSHTNDVEAKLAVDAEFEAYGVYGRADAGPPPFPSVTYGVYGTTNQTTGYGVYASNTSPGGDAATVGGGVALFATGSINGGSTASGTDSLDNHVAIIENTSLFNTHVLALSMPNDSFATEADNFITFYHGGETAADARGAIEANSTGVNYKTASADFAEWLPRKNQHETLEAGDIVGLSGGKVSRNLIGAESIQVISTAPGFSGNAPAAGKTDRYAQVSFMGQVPTKVRGIVQAGDFILASGDNDGVGIAISADKMTSDGYQMIVGRAWESSDEEGVKLINTAVGLGVRDAYAYIHQQARHMASLQQELSRKLSEVDAMAVKLERLTQRVASIQVSHVVANR